MTDAALRNAEARRDALAAQINAAQQQIDEWKRELRGIDQFIEMWNSFAKMPVEAIAPAVSDSPLPMMAGHVPATRKQGRNSKKEEVAEAALNIIREVGEPMPRSRLYEELVLRGLRIGGTDPEMVLSTMLWRMKDVIVRLPKFGYWPRDEKFAPAGYDPSIPYPGDQEHSDMVNMDLSNGLPDVD